MSLPYVVSADIQMLLTPWAAMRRFTLPPTKFFTMLQRELQQKLEQVLPQGTSVEIVTENELSQGLHRLVDELSLPAITLDRTYLQAPPELRLDLSRWVDGQLDDIGVHHRAGTQSQAEQLLRLRSQHIGDAVLVDDVIFTGGLIVDLLPKLEEHGVRVKAVVAGIGIGEGVRRIQQFVTVHCVREYEAVTDEVCERDFYPGVPLSGRSVGHAVMENLGAPYILPYGKPVEWASIPPDRAQEFSDFCRAQTRKLFGEIGRLSCRPVRCCDLGRGVVGLPYDNTRFIDVV
jgi:hypothetical protein